MYKHIPFLLAVLFILVNTGSLSAAEIISSENINLDSESEAVDDNYYLTGFEIVVEKDVLDDLSIAGGSIIVEGNVSGDLNVAGKDVIIKGDIGEDVLIVGGNVSISGNVSGDILIFGGKVSILDSSTIDGDIIILGGELDYQGNLFGDLVVITGTVLLNGYIGGDSTITTQKLGLGDFFGSSNNSAISYFSPEKIEEPEGLEGQFVYNRTKEWRESRLLQSNLASFFGFWSLLRFITTILMIYLLIYLFKPFTKSVIEFGYDKWLQSFIVGLITTIAIPAIAIILMVSLIGLPIGVILLIIFSIILIIKIAVASMIVGGWIRSINDKMARNKHSTLFYSVAGLCVLLLVKYIPYIGEPIFIFVYIIAIGAVINYLYRVIFKRLK